MAQLLSHNVCCNPEEFYGSYVTSERPRDPRIRCWENFRHHFQICPDQSRAADLPKAFPEAERRTRTRGTRSGNRWYPTWAPHPPAQIVRAAPIIRPCVLVFQAFKLNGPCALDVRSIWCTSAESDNAPPIEDDPGQLQVPPISSPAPLSSRHQRVIRASLAATSTSSRPVCLNDPVDGAFVCGLHHNESGVVGGRRPQHDRGTPRSGPRNCCSRLRH